MPFHRYALRLCFLCLSSDHMSGSLGDLCVRGACGGRRQMLVRKQLVREPVSAAPGGSAASWRGRQLFQKRALPAAQKHRATQQRRLRPMAGAGREEWQIACSARISHPQ